MCTKKATAILLLLLLSAKWARASSDDRDSSEDRDSDDDKNDSSKENDSSEERDKDDSSDEADQSARKRDPTSDGADSSAQSYAHDCDGRGVAYCSRPAVTETECPPMCVSCDEDKRTDLTQRAKSRLYDYVYVYRGKICLAHCKGKSICSDWDVYKEVRHCKAIRCKDDRGIDGCHSYSDFTTPSCQDCQLIFPRACFGKPISSDEDSNEWDDSSGWTGHRVYMRAPEPWGAKNSSNVTYADEETVATRFSNVSGWNETNIKNSTVRFRIVP